MKQKWTAFLLVTAMLAGLASCGTATVPVDTVADITADTTEDTTEPLYTDLGDYDFDGRKFTIVYSFDQLGSMWPYDSEEQNGDIVNDAVYTRNRTVEEKYNVDISYYSTGGASGEVGKALLSSVMAGDKAYDLAIGHMFSGVNALVSQHALYNFNDLEIVNFNKPWWAQHLRDTLEVDGVILLHVSSLVYNFNDCIYFNKEMIEDFKLDSPYDLVDANRWTWDKLISMAKAVSSDLNGDGIFDENDRYGYSMSINPYVDSNWVYACGMTVATMDKNGISIDTVGSEKMHSVVEKLNALVNVGNQTYLPTASGKESIADAKLFLDGKSLFTENITTLLPEMRDATLDFGIVPVPKYDSSQEDYYTMATTQMMMLPATTDDPVFTGVILEALSMESYRTVNPAVYEISFSGKYLRDERSYEMYNIIQNSGVYDFNWNFGNGNTFARMMADLIRTKSADTLTSYYDSKKEQILTTLQDIFADIQSYGK